MHSTSTRRTFAMRFGSILSALGIAAAVPPTRGMASPRAQDKSAIRKLNGEGKPGSAKEVIMPIIIHNGLICVSRQGGHDTQDKTECTIECHTTMVMDKIKPMVA